MKGGVSLLDLRQPNEDKLFECSNWYIFENHKPCIVLLLHFGDLESTLWKPSMDEVKNLGGKFIGEAEVCSEGSIPAECIARILVVYGSTDLFIDTEKTSLSPQELRHLKFAAAMAHTAETKRVPFVTTIDPLAPGVQPL